MENYYTILGLSVNATAGEIKQAYMQLARRLHPDRVQDEAERKKANEEFSRVTAAYRTLSDEKLKADYDRSLDKSGKPQTNTLEIQAKNSFLRGLAFLKQNDPWRAVNLLRIACRYHPQPIYLSYLGLALVYTKQYQAEGFDKLKEAARQLMFNSIVHVNLGLAYEYAGNREEALRSFSEALNWDAKNEAAMKGIERISPKKTGFWDKFFGGS